jgi:hypothetical protein
VRGPKVTASHARSARLSAASARAVGAARSIRDAAASVNAGVASTTIVVVVDPVQVAVALSAVGVRAAPFAGARARQLAGQIELAGEVA